MSRFGSQYQVARPTGVCAATETPLEPGDECVTAICDRADDEGFDRFDYSIQAWDDGARPDRLFSYWRMTVPESDQPEKTFVDDDVLMDLFERLGEDERPQRRAFRFVLALVLMRKRLLKFIGRKDIAAPVNDEDGDNAGAAPELWLFRPKGSDAESPPIQVVNPQLEDDDVRELSEQLSEVLQGEL